MELVEFCGKSRRFISPADVRKFTRPVMLYLGCLHHAQGIDTEKQSFFDYMDQLRGGADVHTIMPMDRNTGFADLMRIRCDYNAGTIGPSALAKETYREVYAPLIDQCPDFDDTVEIAILKSELSRISIFAYSYGTSLEQQIAECMVSHLSEKIVDPESKGVKIFEICRSVKAANIGPVARMHRIESDGALSRLRYDDPDFDEARTIFSQMSFLMREDRIVQRSYADESLGGIFASAAGVELRRTASSGLLIDYTQKPMRRAIGYNERGTVEVHIQDPTNHNPRLYTNTHEHLGQLKVFPSLAISPVFRSALASMLIPGFDGPEWLATLEDSVAEIPNRRNLVIAFEAATREFEFVLGQLKKMPEAERLDFLKTYVNDPDIVKMSFIPDVANLMPA